MLTFNPAELRTIIASLTWLGANMKTFAGEHSVSASGAMTGMTVYPGSSSFPEAAALKTAIENLATTFGGEFVWLTGVVDKLVVDTQRVVATMDDSTSLAREEVSKFLSDFRSTLDAMGVQTNGSPTLEDIIKNINPSPNNNPGTN
ncbi:hypothetical protein O7632_13270 [Solwaraspora sp. WMMD406]|uniref:hypothetical protein n=1 Tax=Solwaraspora sp. WMMD406 TaxID=3016095 RepID=UPI0024170769|nr:hypothetical protein [Solwaraspora sp. WMMD406]MDG4765061.1 hypothetical protein [Solwaraspora sp. WMMD406]